jgi:hypothetical protein
VAAVSAADSPLFNFVTLVTLVTLNEVMTPSRRAAPIAEWRGLPERKMQAARWRALCARAPTSAALRARTNFQV